MKNLKISIVIPTYNSEKTLERAIESVINQTYKNIEVIIIDGGSSDKTLNIIKKYKNKIDYWVSEKDDGIYDAMNKGIKKSNGDILYFLGSDDYLYNNNVIFEVMSFLSLKSIYLIEGDVLKTFSNRKNLLVSGKIFFRDIVAGRRPPHQGVFVRKEELLKVGKFNLEYPTVADFDFFCRFFLKYRDNIKYLPKIIAVYNGEGNSSNRKITNKESSKIIKKYFGYLPSALFIIKKQIRKLIGYYQ